MVAVRLGLHRFEQVARDRADQISPRARPGRGRSGRVLDDVILHLLDIAEQIVVRVLARGRREFQVTGKAGIHPAGAGRIAFHHACEHAAGYEGIAQVVPDDGGRPGTFPQVTDALGGVIPQVNRALENAINCHEDHRCRNRGEQQFDQREPVKEESRSLHCPVVPCSLPLSSVVSLTLCS